MCATTRRRRMARQRCQLGEMVSSTLYTFCEYGMLARGARAAWLWGDGSIGSGLCDSCERCCVLDA